MDGVYVPFMVEPSGVEDAIKGIKALNIAGANVTVPYKQTVMPLLDRVEEEAASVGAVNTIVRSEDKLVGFNTDVGGIVDALEEAGFVARGKTCLVFGAGGAARAVLYALNKLGAGLVTPAARRRDLVLQLGDRFSAKVTDLASLSSRVLKADLIVNATSVSSIEESPEMGRFVSGLTIDGCELVMDVNYGRTANFWQDQADRSGAGFMDGIPMLAHQARRSFELWTGSAVDVKYFKEGLGKVE
jgi:shikimate dehydrogenase